MQEETLPFQLWAFESCLLILSCLSCHSSCLNCLYPYHLASFNVLVYKHEKKFPFIVSVSSFGLHDESCDIISCQCADKN